MNFWGRKEVKRSFKVLPFYKLSIENPYTERLNNTDMLRELPFYDKLNKRQKHLKDMHIASE